MTALEGGPSLQRTSNCVKLLRSLHFYCSIAYNLPECDMETGIEHIQLNSFEFTKTLQAESVSASVSVSVSPSPIHPSPAYTFFTLFIFGIECAIETTGTGKDGSIL